jgi:hypothetical protein
MAHKWRELVQLVNLKFEQELEKVAKLRAAEDALVERRGRLAKMNAQALDAFAKPHPSHWHDGDFLWQTWVGKNERALGIEQARLRAIAEMHKPQLRRAFGRKCVVEALSRGASR